MGKQSFYASGSNMGYTSGTSTTWTKESARQGAYGSTKYYGAAFFGSIGGFDFAGKTITNIRLTFDFLAAGSSANKTLFMRETIKTSMTGTGSAMLGESIGNLRGLFYNNAQTFDFNANSQPAIFEALLNHFQSGGRGLCWYNNESSQGTPNWSINYLSVSGVTVTFTWIDDFIWYNRNGTWVRCAAHCFVNGAWRRCKANYNRDGTWIK